MGFLWSSINIYCILMLDLNLQLYNKILKLAFYVLFKNEAYITVIPRPSKGYTLYAKYCHVSLISADITF